jgi:hypothetical protein
MPCHIIPHDLRVTQSKKKKNQTKSTEQNGKNIKAEKEKEKEKIESQGYKPKGLYGTTRK